MTISHALRAILRRWWVVAAVALLAGAAAGVFSALQPAAYSSTATVKINPAILGATGAGTVNVFVDTDPEVLTSPDTLASVAATTGAGTPELAAGLEVEFEQNPTLQGQSTLLAITATAPDAAAAQARAAAFAQAYQDELTTQIAAARAGLEQRRDDAIAQASGYQEQLTANPGDPIVSANLTGALSTLAAVNDQITGIDTWGSPSVVQQEATPGESLATPLWTILAIAVFCGLIAGIGIVLVWDQLDDRVRREEELAALADAPFLGALGYQRDAAQGRNPLPAAASSHNALGEGLRALRTTLQVLLPPEHAVVALTSVEPGDGKTFVSSNLAIAWAGAGRRVIVVGGDLRRPQLTDYFGPRSGGRGLAELLADSRSLGAPPTIEQIRAMLVPTGHRDVQILPAGHAVGDPADLLALPALNEIVASLSRIADVVILDSPPAMLMADASLLARAADGVVLLTTLGGTRKADLVDVAQSLRSHDVPLLGVVGNRSRKQLRRSYAGYYGPDEDSPSVTAAPAGPVRGGAHAHPFTEAVSVASAENLRRRRRDARPTA